ncbi:hypothetical protein [Puniceibacterium sp. IMCC21224]|uniref:phage tail terminator protein n=1 Tax=Puniceibacterium sp. IMCC21224 TaxID=1618204 RepID=UPI00064DB0DB|nr:hypothetical protein [Puniceibacterium sp. IMCC21224]KMK68580.1 hypothetical protein IMCC21224_113463 [Puniceibacterium sp. IMCC21224]
MIAEIVQRLQDEATAMTAVQVAEDIEALAKSTAADHGAAFVVPWRERATPNPLSTGGFRQKVKVQVVVAFVIRQHNDARGSERALMFDGFKSSIEGALAGWSPFESSDPFELVGGEGSALGNSVTIYAQTWETSRFLTGA